jgi:hypothetical protein
MKWIKSILLSLWTTIAGMVGGQKEKGVRRFGIPGATVLMGGFKGLPFLLLIPTLVLGYGQSSWLISKLHFDWLVRIAVGTLLSVPFLFYGIKRWIVSLLLLVGAFSIHAGSLGYIGWFGDILIEDILRYGILGILISWCLFFKD